MTCHLQVGDIAKPVAYCSLSPRPENQVCRASLREPRVGQAEALGRDRDCACVWSSYSLQSLGGSGPPGEGAVLHSLWK